MWQKYGGTWTGFRGIGSGRKSKISSNPGSASGAGGRRGNSGSKFKVFNVKESG
jgi:hypothetical protein